MDSRNPPWVNRLSLHLAIKGEKSKGVKAVYGLIIEYKMYSIIGGKSGKY